MHQLWKRSCELQEPDLPRVGWEGVIHPLSFTTKIKEVGRGMNQAYAHRFLGIFFPLHFTRALDNCVNNCCAFDSLGQLITVAQLQDNSGQIPACLVCGILGL